MKISPWASLQNDWLENLGTHIYISPCHIYLKMLDYT